MSSPNVIDYQNKHSIERIERMLIEVKGILHQMTPQGMPQFREWAAPTDLTTNELALRVQKLESVLQEIGKVAKEHDSGERMYNMDDWAFVMKKVERALESSTGARDSEDIESIEKLKALFNKDSRET